MKNIKIEFDVKWILSKREESVLPVEAITKMLKDEFESEIIYSDLTTCEVVIDNQKFDDEQCKTRIIDYLTSNFKVPSYDNVFTIVVCDYALPKEKLEISESNDIHIEYNQAKTNNENIDTSGICNSRSSTNILCISSISSLYPSVYGKFLILSIWGIKTKNFSSIYIFEKFLYIKERSKCYIYITLIKK